MSSPAKFPGEFHRRYLFESPTADLSSRPPEGKVDSDVVIILAALLCTLISIVGLGFMARCAWSCHWRRRGAATSAVSPPDLAASANKGLKKKTLRALPKTVYGGEGALVGNSSDCAICLTEFIAGEELRVLPQCGHCFHVKCVDTWLSSHSSCPSCRKILVEKGGLSGGKCERCGLQGVVLLTSSSGHVAENHGERTLPEREELSSRGEDDVLRFLPQ